MHIYIHTSPSILQHPVAMVIARERSRQRGEEGWRWRSEFTAFNIGKMKYDRGRRASKEPPFCGIDKFILLPWYVSGWCNFDHRLPRVSITFFSNVYHSFKHSFQTDVHGASDVPISCRTLQKRRYKISKININL